MIGQRLKTQHRFPFFAFLDVLAFSKISDPIQPLFPLEPWRLLARDGDFSKCGMNMPFFGPLSQLTDLPSIKPKYLRIGLGLLALTVTTFATGCGPLLSTYLILSANAELQGAKAAEAEVHAPYEYTAANLYLDKAREQQGYAEFGPAIDFAYKAKDLALKGKNKSLEAQSQAPPPNLKLPPEAVEEERSRIIIKKIRR